MAVHGTATGSIFAAFRCMIGFLWGDLEIQKAVRALPHSIIHIFYFLTPILQSSERCAVIPKSVFG